MFSHVMVGSNDVERSKSFYDALFGKESRRRDDKGRLALSTQRRRLHGHASRSTAKPATMRNGGDDRLQLRQPGRSRCLA